MKLVNRVVTVLRYIAGMFSIFVWWPKKFNSYVARNGYDLKCSLNKKGLTFTNANFLIDTLELFGRLARYVWNGLLLGVLIYILISIIISMV